MKCFYLSCVGLGCLLWTALLAGCDRTCDLTDEQVVEVKRMGSGQQISWKDDNVVELMVNKQLDETSGMGVWWITAPPGQRLKSPVDYGVLPAGAVASEPAKPLEAGGRYEVILFMRGDGESCGTQKEFSH